MKYYIVDAFAKKVFQGNPAGVFVLDHWIEDELMQKIAFENNLSETAFTVKEGDAYHIRWFTPKYEMDLCGHATLATSFIIHKFIEPEVKEILFTSQSGLLKVEVEEDLFTLIFPTRMPKAIDVDPHVEEILHQKVKTLCKAAFCKRRRDLLQFRRRKSKNEWSCCSLYGGKYKPINTKRDSTEVANRAHY